MSQFLHTFKADVLKNVDPYVTESLEYMSKVFEENKKFAELKLKNLIEIILLDLFKDKSNEYEKVPKDRISAAIGYININFQNEITLNLIEEKFGVSKSYFSREFKNRTGKCFCDYVCQKRLELAKKLLKNGNLVIDACFESGFGGVRNFKRQFKSFTALHRNNLQKVKISPKKAKYDLLKIMHNCNILIRTKFLNFQITELFFYDPRICEIDGKYYIMWCTGMSNWDPTIGMAWTEDFEEFHRMENAFLPYNRNGSLFPRKINGNYVMLSRPLSSGNMSSGSSIYLSQSPDLVYWGKHRFVMGTAKGWQASKIGAGPIPIETDEGWLLIYHGVRATCNGLLYMAGCAILDLEKPWKVLYRTQKYILSPREMYERVGDVPNVVFPVSTVCDKDTGRIAMYYGCADTVVGLAYTTVDDLIKYTKENSF